MIEIKTGKMESDFTEIIINENSSKKLLYLKELTIF